MTVPNRIIKISQLEVASSVNPTDLFQIVQDGQNKQISASLINLAGGTSGYSGYSGYSGFSGISGFSGAAGSGTGTGLGRSVTEDGAVGDGITDDTAAIQATVDAVYAAGGGVVYFPQGTYIIRVAKVASDSWKHCITIYPGIVLRGESKETSIIKLKDGEGNYRAFFARPANGMTDMNDVGLYDLTFDQNNSNNAPDVLADLTTNGGGRHILICYGGRRVTVQNCRFIDCKNINTLTFNAPSPLCGDVRVSDCRFEMGVSASIDNDHSTIYTSADNVTIVNNQFVSPALKNYGSRTAIETHGDRHVVTGNIVKWFSTGMNITGVAVSSNGSVVANNVIDGARYGIIIWSWFVTGNSTNPAIQNLTICDNTIIIDRDGWDGHPGINYAGGIFMESTGQAPINNIRITDNSIIFLPSVTAGIAQDNLSCGIGMLRTTIGGVGYDEDVVIEDNIIKNSIGVGIDLRTSCRRLSVKGNKIINPGQSLYEPLSSSFRSGVLVFPIGQEVQDDWVVSENEFIDDQDTPTMICGIQTSNVSGSNCRAEDNIWRVKNAIIGTHRAYIGSSATDSGWIHRWSGANFIPSDYFIGPMKAGSTVTNSLTGVRYTQYITPQGSSYIGETPNFTESGRIPFGKLDSSGGLDDSANLTRPSEGNLILGSSSQAGIYWVNAPAAGAAGYRWTIGGVQRALLYTTGVGEDIALAMYDDAGVFISSPIIFRRALDAPIEIYRPLRLDGGFTPKQAVISSDFTLTHTDVFVTYTGSGGHTLTAPAANVLGSSRPWMQSICNRGSGVITYVRSGSDTIDGQTDSVLIWPGQSSIFTGNGVSDIICRGQSGSDNRIFTRIVKAANLNSANTDIGTIIKVPTAYRVRKVTVFNASVSLSVATFSLRTAPAGAGTAIISAQALSTLTSSVKVFEPTIVVTDKITSGNLTIRCDTAQGVAATADFMVELESLYT